MHAVRAAVRVPYVESYLISVTVVVVVVRLNYDRPRPWTDQALSRVW